MTQTLEGTFSERSSAERAAQRLQSAGFDTASISLVSREETPTLPPKRESRPRSLVGAIVGSLIGGSIGALAAVLLVLIIVGPQQNAFGPGLVCAFVGGTVGWLVGGLSASGRPIEAHEYQIERIEQGRMALTLNAGARTAEARQILRDAGARDIRDPYARDVQNERSSGHYAAS